MKDLEELEDERGEEESEDEEVDKIRKDLLEDMSKIKRQPRPIGNFLTS